MAEHAGKPKARFAGFTEDWQQRKAIYLGRFSKGSGYSKADLVQNGTPIIPASGETAEDIARASSIKKSGIILGGDLNIIEPISSINSEFLALAISNGFPHRILEQFTLEIVHIHSF